MAARAPSRNPNSESDNPAWGSLRAAFDQVCDRELLPMRQAEECEVRRIIDEAAALALDVQPDVLADWRRRLAAEPTITNAHAAEESSDERTSKISMSVGSQRAIRRIA